MIKRRLSTKSLPDALFNTLRNGFDFLSHGTTHMLCHYLYQSQSQYVKSYLVAGNESSGFLMAKPSAAWQSRLRQFDIYIADLEERARAAGVPLVVVMVPNRAQAAMISMGEWPAGYDPYKLDDELRSIITSHGGTYIDILPDFRDIPNPEQGYFPVDGHPNAGGHAIVSRLLAKELTSGVIPALRVTTQPRTAPERGR
jgi:hypothetical protein